MTAFDFIPLHELDPETRRALAPMLLDTAAALLRANERLPVEAISDLADLRDDIGAPPDQRDRASELLAAALHLN